jgi:GTPase Era involved in 16S rRNA processing
MTNYRSEINVVIVGTVSAGKSTLTNALFVEQFSDMNRKRTTALPQVYYEISDEKQMSDLDNIRENNRIRNTNMMEKMEKKEKFTIDDIQEIKYYVPKVFDLLESKLMDDIYLTIYDTPGLNDGIAKEQYCHYMHDNFYKFDIILYVIDINSAFNTSDETDILKLILTNMKKNFETYGITNKLIILLNKCDDMEFIGKSNKTKPLDDELIGMVKQAENITNTMKEEIFDTALIELICISCEDAYIYRMYKRNPKCELDSKYITKFGSNEYGKSRWNRLSEPQKRKKIVELFKKNDYKDNINLSGFGYFKKFLGKTLSKSNQYQYLINHLKYDMQPITNSIKLDSLVEIEQLSLLKAELMHLNKKYKIKTTKWFDDYIIKFTDMYKTQHLHYMLPDTTIDSQSTYDKFLIIRTNLYEIKSRFGIDKKIEISNINTNISNHLEKVLNDNSITKEQICTGLSALYDISPERSCAIAENILFNIIEYNQINTEGEYLEIITDISKRYSINIENQLEIIFKIFKTLLPLDAFYMLRTLFYEHINKYYIKSSCKYRLYVLELNMLCRSNLMKFDQCSILTKTTLLDNLIQLIEKFIELIKQLCPNAIINMDDVVDYMHTKKPVVIEPILLKRENNIHIEPDEPEPNNEDLSDEPDEGDLSDELDEGDLSDELDRELGLKKGKID